MKEEVKCRPALNDCMGRHGWCVICDGTMKLLYSSSTNDGCWVVAMSDVVWVMGAGCLKLVTDDELS